MMRRSRLRVPMLEFLSGNQRQSLARDSIGTTDSALPSDIRAMPLELPDYSPADQGTQICK